MRGDCSECAVLRHNIYVSVSNSKVSMKIQMVGMGHKRMEEFKLNQLNIVNLFRKQLSDNIDHHMT